MKLRLLLAGLSVCSVLVMAPAAAHAMVAPPSCIPAALAPTTTQAVPANLPGFGYTAVTAQASDVHLFAAGSSAELPVTLGPVADGLIKIAPVTAFAPGSSYRIEVSPFCQYSAYPPPGAFTFTVGPEAPLPAKLGEALAPPTVTVKDLGTSSFTVSGTYSLDPAMKPWTGVYQLLVIVDGKPVSTKATLSPAADSVSVVATGWCDDALASANTHSIRLRGRLPFAATLESAALPVAFSCPAPRVTTLPNNPPSRPTGAGIPDEGNSSPSARSGGCSMSPASDSSSSWPLLGVALGLAALMRRRVSAASSATRRT